MPTQLQQVWRMMRIKAATIIMVFTFAGPAWADPAVERGEAVVEKWCRTCHLQKADEPDPDMAPPYEAIVLRPGRDRAYFDQFMREDHFPMTIFRLFDEEKADVAAYLMHLQKIEMEQRQ